MQSKEGFASGGNLDNGLYHYKNKLGEVEARNVQSRMSDLYKPDFKKYLREARKMYDESELSDEAIFNIWKKQNLDKYPHPKETIDVNYDEIITQDLNAQNGVSYGVDKDKLKNLGIMSQKQQGKSMDLSEFLDENGAVDYQKLENLAVNLPSSRNYKNFLGQFDNDSKAIIKTPIADLEVNPRYMFYHLTKDGDKKGNFKGNTKENRIYLSGGVLEILQKPLFITQDKSGTIYFYKAFKNNKGLINLISIAVPKNNSKMFYRTSYNGSNSRISILIKEHTLIYKAD